LIWNVHNADTSGRIGLAKLAMSLLEFPVAIVKHLAIRCSTTGDIRALGRSHPHGWHKIGIF
jgi:hypothetical protein